MPEYDKANETPELHRVLLKEMLRIISKKLSEAHISWWCDGGTSLGIIRDGDIIPHDDDVDIAVDSKFFRTNKFLNILKEIDGTNLIFTVNNELRKFEIKFENTTSEIKKLYVPNLWTKLDNGKIIGTPTLDIFSYKQKGTQYILESIRMKKEYPKSYYIVNELFPLVDSKFGDVDVKIARNTESYLRRFYGDDYMTPKMDIRDKENPLLKNRNNKINASEENSSS